MPHNFLGTELKVNSFRKGTFADPYDEPTYLTFALDFKFENDPSDKIGSKLSESRLWQSPLFDSGGRDDNDVDNAQQFLISRGYTQQASGLKQFREIFRYLTFDAPWYFQGLGGLSAMFKGGNDVAQARAGTGAIIEVNTLEAVDLRIFELAALYRNAIYDLKFRRERVPDNLRWFSMDIWLAEFRNIRYRIPGIGGTIAQITGVNTAAIGNAVTSISEISNNISGIAGAIGGERDAGLDLASVLKQFGYIKFKCRQCEFDFSETFPIGTDLKIGGTGITASANKFKIKVGYFEEESQFADNTEIYDDPSKTDIKGNWGFRSAAALAEGTAGAVFGAGENLVRGIGSFGSAGSGKSDSPGEFGRKAREGLASIGNGTPINDALAAAVSLIDPPVGKQFPVTNNKGESGISRRIDDAYPFGYVTNNDQVPPKKDPPTGNIYQ